MVVRLSYWVYLDGTRLGVLCRLDLGLENVLVKVSGLFEVLVVRLVWSDLARSDQYQGNGEMVVHYDLSRVPYPLVLQGAIVLGIFGCGESECDLKQYRYVNLFGDGRFCCFCCT